MIYICIPSHNEEQTVGVVLWKIRQVMAELGRDYQLLVADDGSTDRTPEVLEPYTRVLPLTVLRSAERRGYAASLEMLLREAVQRSKYPRRDSLIVLQADFTEDPDHIGTLLKGLESGADIVASNALPDPKRAPLLRRWSRALAARIVQRLTWPDEVRDPLTGFSAYRVATIRQAMEEREGARLLTCEGMAANAELLRAAAPHARRIDAVEFTPRRERLQRPTRFRALGELRRVRSLNSGGRPALDVAGLAPSAVVGGVSRQISTAGADATEERARGNGRQRADGATARRSRGGARRGGSSRSRTARPAKAEEPATEESAAAPQEAAERKRRRKPRKRTAKAPVAAAEGAQNAPADGGPTTGSEPASQAAPTDAGPTDAGPTDAGPTDAEPQDADPGAAAGPKKPRRRGRRGGRGRRRKTASDTPGENGVDAPLTPADSGDAAPLTPVPQEET